MYLKNWRAKRAGGRITVYGTDVNSGTEAKLTRVDKIEPAIGGCVATRSDGSEHRLLLA